MSLADTFRTCLGIRRDESVLLLTDSKMPDVARVVEAALSELTDRLSVLSIEPRKIHGEELPASAAEAMRRSNVVLGVTSKSMTHTQATRDAAKAGSRIASMPGITLDMLTHGAMTADYTQVAKTAKKLAEKLTNGSMIEIETQAGTRFTADISGRKGKADAGLLRERGVYGNLPGGEAFIAPVEGTSSGRIVFDGPIASSGLDHKPITVDVDNGMAVKTDYSELNGIFNSIENARLVGEIGIGVNPAARITGNILEDEKVLGTAHIAFGNNLNFGGTVEAKVHMDGIIRNPTIRIDGVIVEKKGVLLQI